MKNKPGVAVSGHANHLDTSRAHTAKIADGCGQRILQSHVPDFDENPRHSSFKHARDAKAALAERFNCTLKEKLYRYLTAKNTRAYLLVLQSFVQGYNATVHRSIGKAPKDVADVNEAQVWHRPYDKRFLPKKKNKQTLLVKGDTGAFEQETSAILKRVFARVDRRGFCDQSGRSRGSMHLQSKRMGWDSGGRYILQTRFATGDRTR